MSPLIVHADWSKHAAKRWMTVIEPSAAGFQVLAAEPVGPPASLLGRLCERAGGAAVALGIDCPIGLPRSFAARHLPDGDFPAFLRNLPERDSFLDVAATLAEVSPVRPFYPARGVAGMTRLAHARALGLDTAADLCRACDRATPQRPAGAPVFWTLGANQSGKAAIAAWRELIVPALAGPVPVGLWPFEGHFRDLLARGGVAIAETYPAEAMRQLGVVLRGSKRRQADRTACVPAIRAAIARLGAVAADAVLADGFGHDAAGEDRMDSLLGALCVLGVVTGARPDTAPTDAWVTRWEGWVLGQVSPE